MLKKFAFPVGLWYNKSYCAVLAVTFYMSLSAGSGKDIITLNKAFRKGILQGIPIALGYLSVSFGFGIMAVRAGLSVSAAVAISITNVTSAGQAASKRSRCRKFLIILKIKIPDLELILYPVIL